MTQESRITDKCNLKANLISNKMGNWTSSATAEYQATTDGSSDVESPGSGKKCKMACGKAGHKMCPAIVGLYWLVVITCLAVTIYAVTATVKLITIDLAAAPSCSLPTIGNGSVEIAPTAEPLIGGDVMNEIDG